jgi:hypothetical protein
VRHAKIKTVMPLPEMAKRCKDGSLKQKIAARSQGLVLATNNVREFGRVEGLRVEKWV